MKRKKKIPVKTPLRLRLFFSISIFLIVIVSSVLSSFGISILSASGLLENIGGQTFASMMIAMCISLVIGALVGITWGQVVLNPVCEMIDAIIRVKDGDYLTEVSTDKYRGLFIGSEVTDLKNNFNQLIRELNKIEIFRKDFISNFSHEFKTPITSICGFAEQIYKGDLSHEEEKEFAKIIMDESRRLATLSSHILLLSKLESQSMVFEKHTFSLSEQLRTAVLLFEEEWNRKNLTFNLDFQEVNYYQNSEMLFLIWKNLLSNAITYTPSNGSITVTCKKENGSIYVSVADTGIGMDAETIALVFDKFYQYDSSHSMEGNGLGMSIVKQVVLLTKAEISILSEPNVGSTITVVLPPSEKN